MTAARLRPYAPRHAGRLTLLARAATVMSAVVATLFVGGVAFAWWSTSGRGSGTASTGTVVALTATAATPSTTLLTPGGTAPLVMTVKNPNAEAVVLTAVQLDGTRTVAVAGAAGSCTAPPISVSATTSISLPGGGTTTVTVPAAVSLGAAAPTGCQGASFGIPVVLTGRLS